MAEQRKWPSWTVPAVIGAFIVAFIVIVLISGSLARPGGRNDPSSSTSPANAAASGAAPTSGR